MDTFTPPISFEPSAQDTPIVPAVSASTAVSAPSTETSPTPANDLPTFAINGFGRIGRTGFRVWWEKHRQHSRLVAINTSGSAEIEDWAHLLKYDSNYGVWPHDIVVNRIRASKEATDETPEIGTFTIDGHEIVITAQRDPAKLPWARLGVQTVIESTGAFVTQEKASLHLQAGAKRVVLSAPAKGEGFATTVLGVMPAPAGAPLISNASCTTNCVAPVVQIMEQVFGIEKALMTTIHAYTDDQNLQDNSHKDMRRARSAAINIVPTSTGAAKTTAQVVPSVKGIFDGLAVRVPVSVGSLSDMTFVLKRDTTVEEVNRVLADAARDARWQGILAAEDVALVSSDIVGRSESSIVDLQLTQVVGGNLVKVVSWYDNEWGYCNRLIEASFQ